MFDTGQVSVPAPDLAALRLLGDRLRPLAGAEERVLPVPEPLARLLPQGGLRRGSTVATGGAGATSLGLALAGPVTASGSWVAAVGLDHLGLLAAAELGVDLERLLLVVDPGPQAWASTVASLLDAVDLVLIGAPERVSVSVQRRLTSRARERGSVLLQVGGSTTGWAHAPDLVLAGSESRWMGLGPGHGRLQARRMEVAVTGRRGADRPRRASLWLPGPDGIITAIEPVVPAEPTPVDLRHVG